MVCGYITVDCLYINRCLIGWSDCGVFFFFFQAEDGIRDRNVTGVQTCALPILPSRVLSCTGTPMTGMGVVEANMPGKWAAPPAPAIMTDRPRWAAVEP